MAPVAQPRRKRRAADEPTLRTAVCTESEDYELLNVIGEGTFSVVHRARASDGSIVAVKRLKRLEQAAARIRDEVRCLWELQGCEHVVELVDCVRKDGQVDIILP